MLIYMNTLFTIKKNRIAVIAYIPVLGLLIAFIFNFNKKNAFIAYHIRQSLGLIISSTIILWIRKIPLLGDVIGFLLLSILIYIWFLGIKNAIDYKKKPILFIGEKFHQLFKPL